MTNNFILFDKDLAIIPLETHMCSWKIIRQWETPKKRKDNLNFTFLVDTNGEGQSNLIQGTK